MHHLWGRIRFLFAVLTLSLLSGCVTIDYPSTKTGRLSGTLIVMWVAEDKFVFAPDRNDPLTFTRTSGHTIRPGLMYTDGGSIPKIIQPLNGFSPWGYAPAYMIHDWIFIGRHCLVDGIDTGRFADLRDVTFDDSAIILAEVVKTLIETRRVPRNEFAFGAISNAVDSFVAKNLWDKPGACRENLVSPEHAQAVRNAQLGGDRELKSLRSNARPTGRRAIPVARFSF